MDYYGCQESTKRKRNGRDTMEEKKGNIITDTIKVLIEIIDKIA